MSFNGIPTATAADTKGKFSLDRPNLDAILSFALSTIAVISSSNNIAVLSVSVLFPKLPALFLFIVNDNLKFKGILYSLIRLYTRLGLTANPMFAAPSLLFLYDKNLPNSPLTSTSTSEFSSAHSGTTVSIYVLAACNLDNPASCATIGVSPGAASVIALLPKRAYL